MRDPAHQVSPPIAKEAGPPEMHPWSAEQLQAFLAPSKNNSELHAAWHLLAFTGMRRGELLALRWRDVDPSHRQAHCTRERSANTTFLIAAEADVEDASRDHRESPPAG